jgi:tetratricopeptide (TPR) repeat protein/tRNA A-37 threonylcarbamoyl transferase component Bud32
MIGQTFSHYRILESLAEGGMGSVYVAEDTHLGRRVAIKFPAVTKDDHHYRARFLREARAVSMLNHPNIAAIYDYGETDEGQPFIVMELVKGPTLGDLLHEHGLTLRRAVKIIESVAEALSEAHSKGIVHRDIKPTNVVFNERNAPKVLDFGLAKQMGEDHSQATDPDARTLLATKTRSGVIVGTPLYLSPEQATGSCVDQRSDIFALGALLYECIAGRPAFDGETVIEIVAQVIHFDAPAPSTFNPRIPAELDRIALKALQKRPDARYQSVEELLMDLRAAHAHLEENGHMPTMVALTRFTGRASALHTLSDIIQRPRLSIGAVLAVVLALGLLVWGVVHWLTPSPHMPADEAHRWYEVGTAALRDGSYYQASRALERAVEVDNDYALAHASLAEAYMELDYLDRAKDSMLRVATLASGRAPLTQQDSLYVNAVTAYVRRDFPAAVKAYLDISNARPDDPQALVDLGRAYESNEETKKAIESYIKATNLNQQYATPYLRVGILYGRQQEIASANASLDKAEAIYQALGNVEGRAEVLFQRGALFLRLGKMDEARDQLQRALDMARATGSMPQQIRTMLQLVYIQQNAGDTDGAQKLASDAIALAQNSGMENLTARAMVDLGSIFFLRKDFGGAERYFQQGLELARRYRAQRNGARALFMLGNLRIAQGNIDEGVSLVEQSLSFYQQANFSQETSRALTVLARATRQKGDYDAAIKAFGQLMDLAQKVGDKPQEALSHEGIGTVLYRQERFIEALEHFNQSYVINKSLNDQKGQGNGLLNKSDVQLWLGRYEEARASLAEAAAIANQPAGTDKSLTAEIHLLNAEMALGELRFSEAKEQAEQAVALAGAQADAVNIEARRVLGLARAFSGNKHEGRLLCEEALKMAEVSADPWLVARVKLSLAQAMLEDKDAEGALATSLQAEEAFQRTGQLASLWVARLLAARASELTGDKGKATEYYARASDSLTALQQSWGSEAFNSYLSRPDVDLFRKQLGSNSNANK